MVKSKNTALAYNAHGFSEEFMPMSDYCKLYAHDELENLNSFVVKLKNIITDNFFVLLKQDICIEAQNITLLSTQGINKTLSKENNSAILSFKGNNNIQGLSYIALEMEIATQITDFLLGATQGIILERRKELESHKLTLIERSIIKQLLQIFLRSIIESFGLNYYVEDIMQSVYFYASLDNLLEKKGKIIYITLNYSWQELNSKISIILPYEAIYNLNNAIDNSPTLADAQSKALWGESLKKAIKQIELEVEGVINKKYYKTLKEISSLKVGDTLFLGSGSFLNIDLFCNHVKLAQGKACEKDGQIGVVLEE
jgi:flagellar motor switch protein FliM